MESQVDPMDEGKLAAANKEDRSTCPYDSDSEEFEQWNEGYDYVEGSDEDGEPLDE